jgi:hypothetical protein
MITQSDHPSIATVCPSAVPQLEPWQNVNDIVQPHDWNDTAFAARYTGNMLRRPGRET